MDISTHISKREIKYSIGVGYHIKYGRGDPHERDYFLEQRRIFGLRRREARGFFFEEQRDPHEEGNHLNASKANFFVNTGEFLK